jgi:two-component system CheB/CheR fusion protein
VHLLSCRNLLIYLDRDLQDQIMGVFRYACRDDGYLILGGAEGAPDDLFLPVDRTHRIFMPRARTNGERPVLPEMLATPVDRLARAARDMHVPGRSPIEPHVAALEAAAPPSVVVDERWNVVHLSPSASQFFQQSGGPLARRITELVRPELRDELHSLLHGVTERQAPQLSAFAAVRFNGASHRVALLAQPHARTEGGAADILVTFLDAGAVTSEPAESAQRPADEEIREAREQLRQAERRIDAMRDERYVANEDLRAVNEELQSLNEEYRSTTEELETSKEELQSINEELQTVNQELRLKLEEISLAHRDLENLIAAADVAILFLDPELRITRFTPQLGTIFNIKTRDLDRPIGDLTHALQYETFEADARSVLSSGEADQRTVSGGNGRVYLVRLRAYTSDGRQTREGIVVTFLDVTAIKLAEASLRESERHLAEELEIMRRLHQMTVEAATAPSSPASLQHIVTAAVDLVGARYGTVEVLGPDAATLEFAAHIGFPDELLATVQEIDRREDSACDRARQRRGTIEVPDVLEDKAYRNWGTDVLKAGYRAVQCTPLISRNGRLVGCLSVYFETPHAFSKRDRQLSAMIGQQGADLIESRQQHRALGLAAEALRVRTEELRDERARGRE